MFGVVGLLEEKFDLSSSLGFDIQRHADHQTSKIKLYSVRASKQEKLMNGREKAMISKFNALIFKRTLTYSTEITHGLLFYDIFIYIFIVRYK